jgi:hypothetical protein
MGPEPAPREKRELNSYAELGFQLEGEGKEF